MPNHDAGASRLFLSADLVGSTAFKQRDPKGWLGATLGFYQQFPTTVAKRLSEESSHNYPAITNPPISIDLWKAQGDELIFSCLIKEEIHAALAIKSFVSALKEWANSVDTNKKPMPLKGGAWVATFPLPDRAIAVISNPSSLEADVFDPDQAPEQNNRSLINAIDQGRFPNVLWPDFVGPGMDLGFRLVQHASPRKFVLSLEAAWLLAEAESKAELYFGGEVELRGFDHGGGYPLFWLDVALQREGDNILDEIQGIVPVRTTKVCELAKALSTGEKWPTKFYLPSSTKTHLQIHHSAIEKEVVRLNMIQDTQAEVPKLDP